MIVGVIKTKDIILHPVTIIQMKGVRGFLKILKRALSSKSYRFINFMENTTSVFISRKHCLKHK